MKLVEFIVKQRAVVVFATVLLIVGGLWSYFRLGKLEDPEFAVKTAVIVTRYPGASPAEVEEQVSDVVEKAVQQFDALDVVRSLSRAGLSIVHAEIKKSYRKDRLPQVWDELRRKVNDAQSKLPPGAGPSVVRDDFGDVYGVVLALTGDGYSYADLKHYADILQRELLLVDDVSRVELWGEQREVVNVEISRSQLAELKVHPQMILETLQRHNTVVDAGALDVEGERIRLAPTGMFASVDEIGDLVVRGSPTDPMTVGTPSTDLVLLRDVAGISRGYLDPPLTMMRFNGKPAIGLAVSTVSGGNVVKMGQAVHHRLDELLAEFPAGLEVGTVSFQADNVQEAINGFMINLIESLVIVIAVLLVTMGMRSGLLIGSGLVLTILGTLIVLLVIGVDLQRTSLGAFIIAMGMLVDNAIVVVEGILIRLQKNEPRMQAVTRPVAATAWPLLGATLVAVLAFLPVYLSEDNTGEYCESLFVVVGVSLMVSWVLAMTQTPVFCDMFLKIKPGKAGTDPYAGRPYRIYAGLLKTALHHRLGTMLLMVGLLTAAVLGFGFVDQIFFPDATRPQFMVDYWLPEGSRIQNVAEDLKAVEEHLLKQPGVVSVATFLGSGPPRFYLPYEPELPNQAYGHLVVNVKTPGDIDRLFGPTEAHVKENFPQAEPRVRRYCLGPSVPFEIEARFSGPDVEVLHRLAREAQAVMRADQNTKDVRDDWRQPVKTCVPVYSQARGRRTFTSRSEMAISLREATSGMPVGLYREGDELLPILVRAPKAEREDIDNLENVPVWGHAYNSVPLRQVVSDIQVRWEDPIRRRRDRRPTITVQCDPQGALATTLFDRLRPKIEAIPLPMGYELEWGGMHEDSSEAQSMVFSRLPVAAILMSLIVVFLFNSFRQPLIILLVLPLSVIGITAGLLLTGQPFGFMALLGAMSLFGMLIKNAVVLLDQIDIEIREGKPPYQAVVDSSVSRMRPVTMASLTTVVGMFPLLTDPLFNTMAITIMFGLSFATVLTLFVVPVLYAAFFGIRAGDTTVEG
ncbi:MAG: efflux RND transporter permease subunit [Planctomycetaceae bacterium]|nr:efflux RND transporter permease subunit [Planctomycetaceae bacterium]